MPGRSTRVETPMRSRIAFCPMPEFSRMTGDIIALAARRISAQLRTDEINHIPGAEDNLFGVNDMLAASILELDASRDHITVVLVVGEDNARHQRLGQNLHILFELDNEKSHRSKSILTLKLDLSFLGR